MIIIRRRYRPDSGRTGNDGAGAQRGAPRSQVHRDERIETAAALERNILQPLLVCTAQTI